MRTSSRRIYGIATCTVVLPKLVFSREFVDGMDSESQGNNLVLEARTYDLDHHEIAVMCLHSAVA
jgi:hypothetical protein